MTDHRGKAPGKNAHPAADPPRLAWAKGAPSPRGLIRPPQLTPSLRCRLVDDVVYWKVSFLLGKT
jgi:hypothetical protein